MAHAQKLELPFVTSPAAEKLSATLFLAHSTTDKKFAKICAAQCISSKGSLAAETGPALPVDCDEVLLGTSNDVFFYAGLFRYPNTSCGLLFSRTLEEEHQEAGVATPFDSGGLRRHVTLPDSAESIQSFLARHEMPIPGYRQYLCQVMTALFAEPKDYLEDVAPCHPCPVGLIGGDSRRWTHEVRIPERVHVQQSSHLLAVFAPKSRVAANPQIRDLFRWCEGENVDTILFNTSRSDDFVALQRECLSYIRRELY